MSIHIQSKPPCRCVLNNSNMMRLNEASPFPYLLATPSFPLFSLFVGKIELTLSVIANLDFSDIILLILFVQLATNASLVSFNSQKYLQTKSNPNSSMPAFNQ
ncbi:hypothetical protein C8F04DRAFT_1141872, partial [Mycena alexandri]